MARYRFHATNGSACVFDAVGRDVRRLDRLTRRAAERVMGSLEDQEDWAQWRVSVHDSGGQRVLVQPFMPRADAATQAA
ncbi:hypothetical protein HNR00_001227 [Methylorubrum rhodinum]|uniref:DUF6894 domain-containing protein n=1 Tax=Methylorubrum rhodinum TaxID=29428 RepID=A0A840ZFK3_9HYPH|nr:hypothetical protein [Methylorubrum rhodinum]MBB5756529.1 hypothetical protein [Methylorubrum rhodinum]